MDRFLTVDDVAETLHVSPRTAYGYMAQMVHLSKPLRVTESALRIWIADRTVDPGEKKRKPVRIHFRTQKPTHRIPQRRTQK